MSELVQTIRFSQDENLPFFVLGAGSNVLISDKGFAGVVIKLVGDFRSTSFEEDKVVCGAGASLIKLGVELAQRGCSGFEYMAVIPGTVGGAVRINAGTTKNGEVSANFVSALVLEHETGKINEYDKDAMQFEYRQTALSQSKNIIIQAVFQLPILTERENSRLVINKITSIKDERARKQPRNYRTFGSTFKKPETKHAAGWYLEKVGMKGMQTGDAMFAMEHANWILNLGKAKTVDIKKLIKIGKQRVFEEYGINLQREVVCLPEDLSKWK